MRWESWLTTAMMTVGSVRGKQRFEMPFLVAQSERSLAGVLGVVEPMLVEREARSLGGQVRFVPAFMESVGWPHWAQNGFRAFQSRRARAWA